MNEIQQYLNNKQNEFEKHPFFDKLKQQEDFEAAMTFIPKMTFWVMAFQDILDMIPRQLKTVHLRRIATHHKFEDAGHERWFLEDATFLGNSNINNVEWLFRPEQRLTREITYRIICEVFKGTEYQKIFLILVLESTGHVFFANMANFVNANGQEAHLKYFSNYHLDIEKSHEIFEEKLKKDFYSIKPSREEIDSTIAMIERVYEAFYMFFDYLSESLNIITKIRGNEENEQEQPLVA